MAKAANRGTVLESPTFNLVESAEDSTQKYFFARGSDTVSPVQACEASTAHPPHRVRREKDDFFCTGICITGGPRAVIEMTWVSEFELVAKLNGRKNGGAVFTPATVSENAAGNAETRPWVSVDRITTASLKVDRPDEGAE